MNSEAAMMKATPELPPLQSQRQSPVISLDRVHDSLGELLL
jgi:hypothetical protein